MSLFKVAEETRNPGWAPRGHRCWPGSCTSGPRSPRWLQCLCLALHPAKQACSWRHLFPHRVMGTFGVVGSLILCLLRLARFPQVVWFLTFILTRSVLMIFTTENEIYSVYSTSLSKGTWELSQSFCLQATKLFFFFKLVCFPNTISHCYLCSIHSNQHSKLDIVLHLRHSTVMW